MGQIIKKGLRLSVGVFVMRTLTVAFLDRFSPKLAQMLQLTTPKRKNEFVRGQHALSVLSMHNLVNIKLLDAKLFVYGKVTHGFTNYQTDVVNVWNAILAKSGHYLDFLSRFRLSNRFKLSCNKAILKSLFV